MVNLRDLPEHVQKQALAAAGVKEKPKRTKGGGTNVHDGWCGSCHERIVGCRAWEKHSDATGHRRFICWPDPSIAPRPLP